MSFPVRIGMAMIPVRWLRYEIMRTFLMARLFGIVEVCGRRILRLVMMKREESFQEEKREESQCRPANRLRRPHASGLREHVEECRPEHAAGREAEVSLK